MADMSIVGAVAVRVRPDATGFREELRRDVMRELRGYDPEVGVGARLDDDGRALKRDVSRAAKAASSDVKIGVDDAFLKRDLARVKYQMERLSATSVEIGVKTDKLDKALAAQRQAFADVEKYKRAQLDLDDKLTDSVEALAAAQKRAAEAQEKIASARNPERAQKAYREAVVAVQDLERTLAKLKRQQEKNNEALEASLVRQRELAGDLADEYEDAQAILDAQEKVHAEQTQLLKEQLDLERNLNTVRTGSREQVVAMLREQRQGSEGLAATLDRILWAANELDSKEFAGLRQWAGEGFDRDRVAKLRVEADTAMAEAELRALERTRSVRIIAYTDSALSRLTAALRAGGDLDKGLDGITQKYKGMFLGGALAASGVNTVRSMTSYMALSAQHMDKLALSSVLMSQGLAVGLGTLTAGVGLLSKVAVDLGAIGKGAALAPAVLTALGVAAGVSSRGLAVLGSALGGSVDELEAVAPAAVPAVNAVRELFSAADSAGKSRFFAEMLSQIEKMPTALGPLAVMWENAYESQGRFFSGVLSGVDDWFNAGDMAKSVENIGSALDEAATAGKPLTQSLLDLVTVGSEYLPSLGSHVGRLSREWANFIREAKDTGQINVWIEEAGEQLTYLGGSIKGAVGLIGGLGRAAEEAGVGGLKSLSDGLQSAADAVNSDLWQSGLTDIFRGANDGAKLAGRGLGDLGRSIMDTSGYWEHFARTSGETFGSVATNLGVINRESRFLPGLKSMFDDVNRVVGSSESLFRNAGNAMGDGAMLGGKLFDAGVQIADAFMRAWGSADRLTSGLADFIPVAGGVASQLVGIAHAVASPLLDGLGAVLSFVSGLPQPALVAAAALALFGGAMHKLRSAGDGKVLAGIGTQFPLIGSAADAARGRVESFRGGWSHMTDLLRNGTSFESATRHLQLMDRSFGGVGRNAGQAALGLAQVRGALSGSNFDGAASSAGRLQGALKGVSNIGVAGLRNTAGGLVNFLGGPWGVAFAVAGAAIGVWAAEVAEAKAHADALQSSLDSSGQVTLETAQQLTQGFENYGTAIGNWFDKANEWTMNLIPGVEQIWTFEGALKATGKTASDVGADVANSGGNWSEYRGALEEANRIIDENGSLTEEQAVSLFGSADAAKITEETFHDLRSEWDRQNNALKDAQRKHQEFADAMGLTSREATAIKKALETVNNEMATTSQRAQASRDVIDLMNGSTRSFLNSVNSQEQAMGGLRQAFETVAAAGKGGAGAFVEYTNALGETSYRLDTTVSELGQLDSALQQSYDSAINHAQAIYDNARAHGDTQSEAAAKANESLSQWRSTASQQLQQMGADAKQAESYLNDVAGKPWTAEVTFMGKTEEYMRAQELVEKSGKSFDGQAFTAFLKANPDVAMGAIEGLVERGVAWSSATYEASLLADGTDAKSALDEIIARGQDLDGTEFQAVLDGDESSFLDAVIAAKASGEDLSSQEWAAKFGIDDTEFQAIKERALLDGETFGTKEWVARLDMENPGFAEKFYAAEANLQGLTGAEWKAYVSSNVDEVKTSQENLLSSLQAMNGTTSTVTVVSNAATEAAVAEAYRLLLSGMDGQEVMTRLNMNPEEWNTVVDALPGNWESKKVLVEGSPMMLKGDPTDINTKMAEAGASLATFTQTANGTATLDANSEPLNARISEGKTRGEEFGRMLYTSTLDGNNQPMNANTQAAHGYGQGFGSSTFTSTLDGNKHPMSLNTQAAHGYGQGFGSSTFTATLDGNNHSAIRSIDSADSKGTWFNGRSYSATAKVTDSASGTLDGIISKINSFAGKVFGFTVKGGGGMADGGIINGAGVQTFATGGFSYTRENHRAFIARPSSTYRFWAEPETGGEAYIPLASSKRPRSTQILGQVADKFGLTVTKHFADGGFEFVGGAKPNATAGSQGGSDSAALADSVGRAVAQAIEPVVAAVNTGGVPIQFDLKLDGRTVYSEMKTLERKFGRM